LKSEINRISNYHPPTKDPKSDFPPNLERLVLAGSGLSHYFWRENEIFPIIFGGREVEVKEFGGPARTQPARRHHHHHLSTTITHHHHHRPSSTKHRSFTTITMTLSTYNS